jgi:tetratricopeptide (TPR) repeat protein
MFVRLVAAIGLGVAAGPSVGESAATPYPLLEFAQERERERAAAGSPGLDRFFANQLGRVRHELALARPPDDAQCAGSMGASRFAALHVQVGDALQEQGDHQSALAAYRSALACRPRDIGILRQIAEVQFVMRDLPAAREAIEQGLAIDPLHIALNRLAGDCDYVAGRWADAMSRYRYVASGDLDPESATFAQLMFWLSQQRAGTSNPAWVPRRLGDLWPRPLVLFVKGEYSETELMRTLRKSEEDPWVIDGQLLSSLFFAGESWWARGEPEVARRYFAAAVNLRRVHTDEYRLALAEIARLNRP